KQDVTGNVEYDADNHEFMTHMRAEKINRIARTIPATEVFGPDKGSLLILGWGGTYGAIRSAVARAIEEGQSVAHAHIRHLNPFPSDLKEIMSRYDRVLIPELNTGHLRTMIRAEYLIDAIGLNKVQGRPFSVEDIRARIDQLLGGKA
ncbi:MAG: 2-oxoglutarate ferredoxin oxidoreductase subunit alpha, partial [Candidatus Eisenbacteria bacterium]|nr:2-oxoglutarate ferredoxin oxidoreductase subunit alpha [Candidatus Eisenbacteria bacterium]